jgi:hypothetical protein
MAYKSSIWNLLVRIAKWHIQPLTDQWFTKQWLFAIH